MAEETNANANENASSKPKRTTTIDSPTTPAEKTDPTKPRPPRFTDSSLTHADYIGTRIRRPETYQVRTMKQGLKLAGIAKLEDFDKATDDERVVNTCAAYLQACLVGPELGQRRVAQLFRKGSRGLVRLQRDLKPREIVAAMKTVAKFADFY